MPEVISGNDAIKYHQGQGVVEEMLKNLISI